MGHSRADRDAVTVLDPILQHRVGERMPLAEIEEGWIRQDREGLFRKLVIGFVHTAGPRADQEISAVDTSTNPNLARSMAS